MVAKINLKTMDDVVMLNNLACNYDGKLTASAGSVIVDARSLMALFALMGRHEITLAAPDHDSDKADAFLNLLRQIA